MNLPNWSTNQHLRRVLQRMQADYTSIFGGRDRELAALDGWLADDSRPYALLLAPTGRGKTALVWHWLARQQHEWQVIFVPVSIRYGNSSQADVFAALTHAFAHMHGELDEFNALQHSANELRPKLAAYLRRDLPADTRVLLAIDGLDEATGWELGADLLPDNPPANLKIMLSARDMAQHQRADWYHKLGLHADRTQDFTLGGLDRIALKELLIALGTPLDELATDFDILGELLRVSAGDPVIVRLLVQLLREERIQIGQLTQLPQDDLNAVFALWLNQLSAQESQLAQILLLLFANAYGPLSARDLLGLAPDHFADAEQITQAIAPLARFVIGDAENGYIFSHQKLRELYRDRLNDTTLAEWNARFVNYGKQSYQNPTPYLCRFLVNHLRDAGEWQFIRNLLADFSPQQAWAECRYTLEGNYNGYLHDLEVLQNWAIEQDDLALSIHCSLISSSIRSMSSNLPGELLIQLIKFGTTKGKWSVETALAHIEQQPSNAVEKLEALIAADIPLPWEAALEIVENGTHYDEEVPYFYTVLYPLVPTQFQEQILQKFAAALTANSYTDNIEILTAFIAQLPEQAQNHFWQQISTFTFRLPIDWLSPVLKQIPEPWHSQLYKQYFAPMLNTLIPQQLNETHYDKLLRMFDYLPSEQQSLRYWGIPFSIVHQQELQILHLLPEPEQQELAKNLLHTQTNQIKYRRVHLANLVALYPQEPALLTQILDFSLEHPEHLHNSIAKLPKQLYYPLSQHLLSNADTIPHHQLYRTLILLLPYVPNLKQQIIDNLLTIIPNLQSQQQIASYCDLIPYLAESQKTTIVEQAWRSSQNIDSTDAWIIMQNKLFQYLNQAEPEQSDSDLIAHLPTNQQQHDDPQDWPTIFAKLISLPNYPHLQLLPHIINLPERSQRVALLINLLKHTAPDQHAAIKQAFEPDQSAIISETTELLDHYLTSNNNQQQQQEHQIIANFKVLLELSNNQQATEQIKQQLSRYLHKVSRSIASLIRNEFAFDHSVSQLDQHQIQAVLDYMAAYPYSPNRITALMPYLNPNQIQQLFQIITASNNTDFITSFYTSAQQHHNIFQQQSYYQSMLNWLQENQFKYQDWDWLEVINQLAPYLDSEYYQILLHTTLKRLETVYVSPEDYEYINRAVQQIIKQQAYNQQTVQYFINYAARQTRDEAIEILIATLPPYLETLAPEQAQQLASQVLHSIDQVCACWP